MSSMDHVSHTVGASIAASGSKATWTGSVVTMLSGITSNDFGMWAGIVIGVAGLVISWVFKHKAERRYEEANKRYMEAHKAYMLRINSGVWVPGPPPVREEGEA